MGNIIILFSAVCASVCSLSCSQGPLCLTHLSSCRWASQDGGWSVCREKSMVFGVRKSLFELFDYTDNSF